MTTRTFTKEQEKLAQCFHQASKRRNGKYLMSLNEAKETIRPITASQAFKNLSCLLTRQFYLQAYHKKLKQDRAQNSPFLTRVRQKEDDQPLSEHQLFHCYEAPKE